MRQKETLKTVVQCRGAEYSTVWQQCAQPSVLISSFALIGLSTAKLVSGQPTLPGTPTLRHAGNTADRRCWPSLAQGSFTSLGLLGTHLCPSHQLASNISLNECSPVTKRVPEGSCLRNTTRLPRKRPERRIRMVPGVMLLRSLVGLCFWGAALAFTSSPAYHLGAFAGGCMDRMCHIKVGMMAWLSNSRCGADVYRYLSARGRASVEWLSVRNGAPVKASAALYQQARVPTSTNVKSTDTNHLCVAH